MLVHVFVRVRCLLFAGVSHSHGPLSLWFARVLLWLLAKLDPAYIFTVNVACKTVYQ
jgi:hypothetical protein